MHDMKRARILAAVSALVLVALTVANAADQRPKAAPAQSKKTAEITKPAAKANPAGKINWVPYDSGTVDAKTTNKYRLVHITSKSCGYCRKMEADVFSDSSVINFINTQFVPVRVWADSDRELDINGYKISEKEFVRSDYPVTGYPTFFFVAPSGRTVTSFAGYRDIPSLMHILDMVKKYKDTAKSDVPAGATGSGK
jgi:thioredoxin-related protein